ncbi:MAG: dienelactone hydrolase family protein [Cytophagales bacterium]
MKLFSLVLLMIVQSMMAQNFVLEKSKAKNYSIELQYQFYSPKTVSEPAPLVVFLHGAGERGCDNVAQSIHGVNGFLKQYERRKFFLLAPQCPLQHRWVETDWTLEKHQMNESPSESSQMVFDIIDSLLKNNDKIDVERIYVCGLSMGGFGTWEFLCRKPGFFAAAIPICGGADVSQAILLKNTPVWAFHGMNDKVVLPKRTIDMVNAIKQNGGNPIITLYENAGHDSWTKTFANDLIYDWLFAQKRNK